MYKRVIGICLLMACVAGIKAEDSGLLDYYKYGSVLRAEGTMTSIMSSSTQIGYIDGYRTNYLARGYVFFKIPDYITNCVIDSAELFTCWGGYETSGWDLEYNDVSLYSLGKATYDNFMRLDNDYYRFNALNGFELQDNSLADHGGKYCFTLSYPKSLEGLSEVGFSLLPFPSSVTDVWGINDTYWLDPGLLRLRIYYSKPDISPDDFSFVDLTDKEPNTVYVSDEITITGINKPTPISVSQPGYYRIDSGDWTTCAGSVKNGQKVQIKRNSSSSLGGVVSCILSVGDKLDTWNITTMNVNEIWIQDGSTAISEDSGAQYRCIARFSNGAANEVSSSASWLENSAYASISSSGYLTTTAVTTDQPCQISVSYGGKSANCNVTIKNIPAALSSVTVTGGSSVNESSGSQYICTAYYSDGSSADVSSSASWSVNSSYASISVGGYLSTAAVTSDQSCQIKASFGGKEANFNLVIKNDPSVKPSVKVIATDSVAGESGDSGAFTFTRTDTDASPLMVRFTVGGTATYGDTFVGHDYCWGYDAESYIFGNLESVTIPAGSATVVIFIHPNDDREPESSETVTVTLKADSSYSVGSPSSATVTISDNDSASTKYILTVGAREAWREWNDPKEIPGVLISSTTGHSGTTSYTKQLSYGETINLTAPLYLGNGASRKRFVFWDACFLGDSPEDGQRNITGQFNAGGCYDGNGDDWYYAYYEDAPGTPVYHTLAFYDASCWLISYLNVDDNDAFGNISEMPTPTRTGYSWDGKWYKTNSTASPWNFDDLITCDTAAYAAGWTANAYTIVFNANGGAGGQADNIAAIYGQAMPSISTTKPIRMGYTFGGWYDTPEETGGVQYYTALGVGAINWDKAATTTLYGRWGANTYAVTFAAKGGTVSPGSQSVTYNRSYGTMPTPTRSGYVFDGWWTGDNGTGAQVTSDTTVTSAGNHTLYAKWLAVYMVTFDAKGGTVSSGSQSVTYNRSYGTMPTPTRSGYVFDGWWTGDNGTGSQVTSSTTVTSAGNHTLYAKWLAVYTVTFDAKGGTVTPASQTVTYSRVYGALPVPSRMGFAFDGWWTGDNGMGTQIASSTTATTASDHSLYAKWLPTYTVTFDAEEGTLTLTNKTVVYSRTYGVLPVAVLSGFTFSGWWTADNGSGSQVASGTIVTASTNHTLYAQWVANTYKVTFDPEGGSVIPSFTNVVYSHEYGMLPVPSRAGYNFSGWWLGDNGTGVQVMQGSLVAVASNHTLFAKWNARNYTVIFDDLVTTNAMLEKTVTYDQAYGLLPEAVRSGYVFSGWWTGVTGTSTRVTEVAMVTVPSDHTLYAKWTARSYTVTFDPSGGIVSPASKTVTFDSVYGSLPTPMRKRYIFSGWWTGIAGSGSQVTETTAMTVANAHMLYAAWTEAPYLCPTGDSDVFSSLGSYDGFFYCENGFSDDIATAVQGTVIVKITSLAGRLTAKAVMQKGSLSFSASMWTATETDGTCRATLAGRSGETLDLYVRQNRIWGTLAGASVGATLTLDGGRNRFADRADTAAQALLNGFRGYYTVALPIYDALSSSDVSAAPEGSGYLTLTVGNNGSAKIAGLLADGTKVSQSSRLILFDGCGPQACVPVFVPLYSKKGWVGGLLWIDPGSRTVVTDRDLGWFVRWEKPGGLMGAGAGPDGFSELLDACGGFYNTIPALASHYRFSAQPNDVPYYYIGGIADIQPMFPTEVGVAVSSFGGSMTRGIKPVLAGDAYDYGASENSSMATLSFATRTGIFKGKFNLYYDYMQNGKLQHKAVSVPYAGVLTPVRAAAFTGLPAGQGAYLAPDNNPAFLNYRLKRSCPVWLEAAP